MKYATRILTLDIQILNLPSKNKILTSVKFMCSTSFILCVFMWWCSIHIKFIGSYLWWNYG